MNRIEVQGSTLGSFLGFKKLFINQYTPLDDKNIAKDKLYQLGQCGSVRYITAFDNVVVVLLELAKEDTIHAFVYGLNPYLKGFVTE